MPLTTGLEHPDIKFDVTEKDGKISKVVAWLNNYLSGRYTKLGRNLLRIQLLENEIKELKNDVKADTKELVADLFGADALLSTRVVETVGFTFHLSKNPEATVTYKYATILEELEKEMTPSLIKRLNELKEQYKTVTQKSPALKATDKAPTEGDDYKVVTEGILDTLVSKFKKFFSFMERWAAVYDRKFDKLKEMVPLTESTDFNEVSESDYDNFVKLFKESAGKVIRRNAMYYYRHHGESYQKTLDSLVTQVAKMTTFSFEESKRKSLFDRAIEDKELWEYVDGQLDVELA